jgi:hypothetical protein
MNKKEIECPSKENIHDIKHRVLAVVYYIPNSYPTLISVALSSKNEVGNKMFDILLY